MEFQAFEVPQNYTTNEVHSIKSYESCEKFHNIQNSLKTQFLALNSLSLRLKD